MAIKSAFAVPHPPLIVPQVGKGKEEGLKTPESYRRVAAQIARQSPVTIVLVTPHSQVYADYIHISSGHGATGSLASFGAPGLVSVRYDQELVHELTRLCAESGFPAGTLGEKRPELDHGTLVPLHFIMEQYTDFMLVRVSISGLSREDHYRFGMLVNQAAQSLSRSVVFVASGDLSHKLRPDGPYGFAPEGPVLDEAICRALESADFEALFDLDEALCLAGAECGLNSFMTLAGLFDGRGVKANLLSYEGTFGVGYAVASFEDDGPAAERHFLTKAKQKSREQAAQHRAGEDEYVRLARDSLEHHVLRGGYLKPPEETRVELLQEKAGVFVSIKKNGQLRGCIGTTEPTQKNLAQEIIKNAVSAGAHDPRFPEVLADELDELVFSVDVLAPAQPCNKSALDPKRYGVIVSQGRKRGLLLPDLEGVDTVQEQLEIACRKAGINIHEPYAIARFEVVRHR